VNHGSASRLSALVAAGLSLLALGLPASAAPSSIQAAGPYSTITCAGAVCAVAFSGSGSATTTNTTKNPDGSTSSFTYKDTFSWRVVYDVPFNRGYRYQRGWNVIGVQAAAATFKGQSDESCIEPAGGSYTVGGGAPSCRGYFENTKGIPLQVLVFFPPSNGSWSLAAPAHQASQRTSGNCSLVGRALDDTCDPLWNGPFPGQGENSPVTARFSARPRVATHTTRPRNSKPMPVSASKSWTCTGSNGTSTDKGSIQWKGTVRLLGR